MLTTILADDKWEFYICLSYFLVVKKIWDLLLLVFYLSDSDEVLKTMLRQIL